MLPGREPDICEFDHKESHRYRLKCELFSLLEDTEMREALDKLLFNARVTLTERFLLEASKAADEDGGMEKGKTLANNQIMAWPQVKVSPSHIQPCLWRGISLITQGKKFVK